MLASMMRTKTFWLIAVVLLAYGMFTLDDEGGTKNDTDEDDKANLTLEVYMHDPEVPSIEAAIIATLGSAGNFHDRKAKVPNFRKNQKGYLHRFQARRGDRLNAEVVNLSTPVDKYACAFYQQDYSAIPEDEWFEQGIDQDGLLRGYGDITDMHEVEGHGNSLARCTGTVR